MLRGKLGKKLTYEQPLKFSSLFHSWSQSEMPYTFYLSSTWKLSGIIHASTVFISMEVCFVFAWAKICFKYKEQKHEA
jgi:uncharacterized membrane protein (GlpM family)